MCVVARDDHIHYNRRAVCALWHVMTTFATTDVLYVRYGT